MTTLPTTPADPDEVFHRPELGTPLLSVRDLKVAFPTEDGLVRAVNGLNYEVYPGRTLAIVGESGSGKSVSTMAVMGLHDPKRTRMSGSIQLDGREMVGASQAQFRKVRGSVASMIFQDAQSSLHPYKRVGDQIIEAYRVHHHVSKGKAMARAVEMLDRVGIPNPQKRAKQYPFEFSGGMRQRAMIALGLVNDPKLLIADEPTTALDVTVQAGILDLLKDLQQEFGSAIILITHDLAVVAEVAHDTLVMYAGRGVERGETHQVLSDPRHPYTRGLLGSVPSISETLGEELKPIKGAPPSLTKLPSGCSFHPRCEFAAQVPDDLCRTEVPGLSAPPGTENRLVRCHLSALGLVPGEPNPTSQETLR